jgi:thiol-disulfide isomerase/thioredoxin
MAIGVAQVPSFQQTVDELLQREHARSNVGAKISQASTAVQDRKAELSEAARPPAAATRYGPVEDVHSEEDLDNWLKQTSGLVVLEVVASSCRVCNNFAPKYKRLAGDYSDVKFLKVLFNENDSTRHLASQRFQIKRAPSFIFLRCGEVVATQQGGNFEDLHSLLRKNRGETRDAPLELQVAPA